MLIPKNFLEKLKKNKKEEQIMEEKPVKKLGHNHQWGLVAKTYAPPMMNEVEGLDGEAKQQAALGVTTILWQCSSCGETKKETMLGNDEDTFEELMQKAELLGPQYIQKNGKTYVFMRWVPPSEQQGFIPVK